ncbi:PREDICTED: spexin isoform X2 [Cercocebus atys]|uniref:spexin isoform X2 n=1 Tax=Cercocebus atys TaxID=9531 RepID=UPI0005F3A5B9|nr:PREDICTED: spexin isoform X2 [Cercocebus atys]
MKVLRSLAATILALFLVFFFLGNSSCAPQRPLERRNWTPQAMLYLKGRVAASSPTRAGGRTSPIGHCRQILLQSNNYLLFGRKERRSPNPRLLPIPKAATILLASLQKSPEDEEKNFDQTRLLEDSLLN